MKNYSKKIFTLLALVGQLIFTLESSLKGSAEKEVWQHVLTLNRMVWLNQDQSDEKFEETREEELVRKLYLDLTGKIPSYDQLKNYLESDNPVKRYLLIENLVESQEYIKHYTNFWRNYLLEGMNSPSINNSLTKYLESSISSNKTFGELVYGLLINDGTIDQHPGLVFYLQEPSFSSQKLTKKIAEKFLGYEIKENLEGDLIKQLISDGLSESLMYLTDLKCQPQYGMEFLKVYDLHIQEILKNHDKEIKSCYSGIQSMIKPFNKMVVYEKTSKRIPFTYTRNVGLRSIVINEPLKRVAVVGVDEREMFLKWLTEKENILFSRTIAYHLWKNIIDHQNQELTLKHHDMDLISILGDIFSALNYDVKNFLKVICNSEYYLCQYKDSEEIGFAKLNQNKQDLYLSSLKVLVTGDRIQSSLLSDEAIEIKREISLSLSKYFENIDQAINQYLNSGNEGLDDSILFTMNEFFENILFLEDVLHNSDESVKVDGVADHIQGLQEDEVSFSASSVLEDAKGKEGADPQSNIFEFEKINAIKGVVSYESRLMQKLMRREVFIDQVNFLYYSLYGRLPNDLELKKIKKVLGSKADREKWGSYIKELLQGDEFIKSIL